MASLAERREHRSKVLRAVYEATEGRRDRAVDGKELGEELGLLLDETVAACEYLEGEGLLRVRWTMGPTPALLTVTHAGVVQMEAEEAS